MEDKKNNTMIIAIIAIVAAVAIAGVFIMMSKNKTETAMEHQSEKMVAEVSPEATASTDEAPVNTGTPEDTEMVAEDGVKTIEVEMGAFYYKPNVITVKKGQKVKLVLKSVDMMHDFNVDELNIKSEIVKSSNTGEVEFTADKVGTYEYYCSVGDHRAKGQIGKLIVQ